MSNQEKIKELEEELSKTKYNKRTQRAIGMLKAKIAQLRSQEIHASSKKAASSGYSIKKAGDATVALVGFPSVGKSTLLNKLTNAESDVGAYEFTTLDVIPGTLEYKHAKIQLLDIPGIITGASIGKGRGREIIAVARTADLIVILADAFTMHTIEIIKKELNKAGIRLNTRPPDVRVKKKSRGGLRIWSTCPLTKISKDEIREVLLTYKIVNGDVLIRDDLTVDEFIDSLEGNRIYIPAITIMNKIDQIDEKACTKLQRKYNPDLIISAEEGINTEETKQIIFSKLKFIRVFCKETGKKADLEEPIIMKKGATVKEACEKLHKDFVKKFTFCRVWGPSAKFAGQKHQLKHILKDTDVIEIHVR